ncbi:MAG: DinB family protein [Acidobacteria bacterium]|nr:DinB family protein [Acidobacteriota bacterium]
MPPITKPAEGEYLSYFGRYVSLVPEGDIIDQLQTQISTTMSLLGKVSEEKSSFRYAPGKWSMKQSLGHIIDTERVFAYRLLAVARGEKAALPSFDQDEYVNGADFDACSWAYLKAEFELVRRSTVALLKNLPEHAWARSGTVSGSPTTARALAFIIAGHELYHQVLFRERYLAA